jgi:hypothetical protein
VSRQRICGREEARERSRYAQQQLALAEMGTPWSTVAERKASGGCAVLAGIAAADAICCRRLGRRSRDEDHRAAVDLLRRVAPEGIPLARDLDAVLAEKDAMQYGTALVSAERHLRLLRAVRRLVRASQEIAD